MNRTTLLLLIVAIAALGLIPASGQTHWEPYAIATVPTGDTAFDYLYGAAVDSTGNIYVADSNSHTISKITASGSVSILAGLTGVPGSADGTGSEARFNDPQGVAVDNAGNVYVADTFNQTIRKITPAGEVTTLAGLAGAPGSRDGRGRGARFGYPGGVAVDDRNNVYVADTINNTIRKISPSGVVRTLAGLARMSGTADGTGTDARFFAPSGVTIGHARNIYVGDTFNNTIRRVTFAGVV